MKGNHVRYSASWKLFLGIWLATILCAPAWSQRQNTSPGRPGSMNYLEGQVAIDTQRLSSNSVGSTGLDTGQSLTTQNGRVEILLSPGIFLRVADNSSVKMISPDVANTIIALDKGRALVEVTEAQEADRFLAERGAPRKEIFLRIRIDETSAKISRKGLYDFDADHKQIRVFSGAAEVYTGHRKVKLTQGRGITLNGKPRAQDFDLRAYADDFYKWCSLRSGYLSEANVHLAGIYVGKGPRWHGSGWYWDRSSEAYTFIPGYGIFYSPFGWGFYSPDADYESLFFYFGDYGHPHHFDDFVDPYGHGFVVNGATSRK